MTWELIDDREIEGFTVRTYAAPEYESPEDFFNEDDDHVKYIRENNLEWFQVKVTASLAGIELADDYIGCCAYESTSDFLKQEYWEDLVRGAIYQAKEIMDGPMRLHIENLNK
jgi:hypothetical protein